MLIPLLLSGVVYANPAPSGTATPPGVTNANPVSTGACSLFNYFTVGTYCVQSTPPKKVDCVVVFEEISALENCISDEYSQKLTPKDGKRSRLT